MRVWRCGHACANLTRPLVPSGAVRKLTGGGSEQGGPALSSLTEILIIRGVMPIEALDNVVDGWKGDDEMVRQLVANGTIGAKDYASARAAQHGLPFVELTEYPVDKMAVSQVPATICRRHEVLPIANIGNTLTLAVVDPGNVFAIDDVRAAVRMQVNLVVAERTDLLAAIDRYHRADNEINSLTTVL